MTSKTLIRKATAWLVSIGNIRIDLRLVMSALCAMGILHICATLAAPYLMSRSAFERLEPLLPANQEIVLPDVTPDSQPIPFLTPDVRYAMCRYDTAQAPVMVTAELPGRGWSLAIHTPDGDNVYAATGEDARLTSLRLRILPEHDRFTGLTPESLGISDTSAKPQTVKSAAGIVVLRAPDKGRAYSVETAIYLRRFDCASELVE